jgi:sphingosine-1-phosphate phosphatase 1
VQRLSVTDDHTKEFGFPSTHSLNSVCMFSYMLLYTKGLNPAALAPLAPLALIWCAGICYSRIYLGMHTPVDIVGGAAIGLALSVSWLFLGEYIDDVFTSHPYSIPLHLLLSLVLLSCYPTPKRPTPSYKYCVYFAGVAVGGNIGLLRTRLLQPLLPPMDPQLSVQVAFWSMRRFAVGIAVVIACLLLTDNILKLIMSSIFRILRIPFASDDDASPRVFTTKSGGTYFAHIDTCRRFLTYGVVCWSVVEPALLLIRHLQL